MEEADNDDCVIEALDVSNVEVTSFEKNKKIKH
jgi:hypothetical protein